MTKSLERLKQYLSKASFSSESDRYSALECVAEVEWVLWALGCENETLKAQLLEARTTLAQKS